MKKVVPILFAISLLGLIAVFWWKLETAPVNPGEKTSQTFIINRGEGVKAIGADLKAKNLIRDEWAFLIMAKRLGIEKKIQAGSYHLSKGMSTAQVALTFTLGTEDIWITIPEGWRSEEIVDYLKNNGLNGQLGDWTLEEGKYFPDTYLVPKQMTIDEVRKLMRKTFDQKVPNITNEQLTIASLVEREARKAEDRPLVASVIWNRYKIGMKLDIDATIQYALGFWKKDLTIQDLAIRSPYNTYTNPGLPPTPICNPGLSAINATINPATTDYLYYLTDKDGVMHYASTIDQHNANVAKYLGL